MKIHPVPGDGNCMFYSCAFFLDIDHQELRHLVAQVMCDYPDLPISGIPLSIWIEETGYGTCYPNHVAQDGFYGSALELTLISIMFRRTIYVFKQNSEGEFKQIADYFPGFGNEFRLLWSGDHYNPITD